MIESFESWEPSEIEREQQRRDSNLRHWHKHPRTMPTELWSLYAVMIGGEAVLGAAAFGPWGAGGGAALALGIITIWWVRSARG